MDTVSFGFAMKSFFTYLLYTFLLGISCAAIADEMEFKRSGTGGNCNGCEWVMAQGDITANTPAKFKEYVLQNGRPYRIALHSLGGNLEAGMELGKLIRDQGATTFVAKTISFSDASLGGFETTEAGICASACAFAFMGGVERKVDQNDHLGVHQFYSRENREIDPETTQFIAGKTLLFSVQMGIDPRVIVAASQTPPEEIYWFNTDELSEYGLDTTSSTTEPWILEPYKGGLVLTTTHHESVRRSVSVTLFCRQQDKALRLLISENLGGHINNIPHGNLLDFSSAFRSNPEVTVGVRSHPISKLDVEFQRIVDQRVLVSLFLPNQLDNAGGQTLSFTPDLARVFGSLIHVSVNLPENSWLNATKENCI